MVEDVIRAIRKWSKWTETVVRDTDEGKTLDIQAERGLKLVEFKVELKEHYGVIRDKAVPYKGGTVVLNPLGTKDSWALASPSGRVYTFSYEELESSILTYLEVERATY